MSNFCVTECMACPRPRKDADARFDTRTQIVNGSGSPTARILFVLDGPYKGDDHQNQLATGLVVAQLYEAIRRAGVSLSDCFFTGATRCYAPWTARRKEVEACRPHLADEVAHMKPEVIVSMGNNALWSTLRLERISSQRGSVFESDLGVPVIPTFSPASLIHSESNMEFIVADIRKAANYLKGATDEPELGEYMVALTLDEVEAVTEYLLSCDEFAFDFETGIYGKADGFNYLDPDARVLCAAFSPGVGEGYVIPLWGQFWEELWSPEELEQVKDYIRKILTCPSIKIAANGKFDVHWAQRFFGVDVVNFAIDAQLLFAMHHEERPHALEYQRTLFTNMPRYEAFKDLPENKELLKEWGYAGYSNDDMWPYAAADADCTFRVYKHDWEIVCLESEGSGGVFSRKPKALRRRRVA